MTTGEHRLHLSPLAISAPELPPAVRKIVKHLASPAGSAALSTPVVVAYASEVIEGGAVLPEWSRAGDTRFLAILDVGDAVVPRLFSALGMRRPDQRVHVTRDAGAVRRLLVSAARAEPRLGIVDAYVWNGALTLVTGDFQFRSFPLAALSMLADMPEDERPRFEIAADGAYLHWPVGDIHLGVSQILQSADPMYLADIAIERNERDRTGAALRRLRESKGLRQADIHGLSERQVRRIEEGISRLRVETAEIFAVSFRMTLRGLLDEVARLAGEAARDGAVQQQPDPVRAE